MLPTFEQILVQESKIEARSALRYYLLVQSSKGHWYFLWKTHANGGTVWVACGTDSRKRPLRYKTISGAQRALRDYTAGRETLSARVMIWKGGAV